MLPKSPTPASSINPGTLIMYAVPKAGKTTILSKLTTDFAPNGQSLLINLEKKGGTFVDNVRVDVNSAKELNALMDEIEQAGKPYKYIAIDSCSVLDEWAEIMGTYNYMKTPQGKSFNVVNGKKLTHLDPEWTSVHELGNGAGYRWSRLWFMEIINRLNELAEHIIFVCHVKDKFVATATGDTVQATEIDLTGKLKSILSSRVDGIAKLVREGTSAYLVFEPGGDQVISGGRSPHLEGKILISEKVGDKIKTHWNKIYK